MKWWNGLSNAQKQVVALIAACVFGISIGGSAAAAVTLPDRMDAVETEQQELRDEHESLKFELRALTRSLNRLSCTITRESQGETTVGC